MTVSPSYYQNSLAKHRIDFFSNYFERFSQIEGLDYRINQIVEIILKIVGFTLDIITAPIRLPIKAGAILHSRFFIPEQIEGLVR